MPKKLPLAPRIAALFKLKTQLDQLDAKRSVLQGQFDELQEELLLKFTAEDFASVRSSAGQVTRVVTVVPQVEDWDKVWKFVRTKNAFELLHKRISSQAWSERLEAGVKVPGIIPFNRVALRLTRAKKK